MSLSQFLRSACARWLVAVVALAAWAPLGVAEELIRLEFENGADLAENTSSAGWMGVLSQTATNVSGTVGQSTDVRPGSTGTGSVEFSAASANDGYFIDFLDDQFPDFGPSDSWSVSVWLKPSSEMVDGEDGYQTIVSGLAENANTNLDWQIDNGNPGANTVIRLSTFGVANLSPTDADLVADEWQQLTLAYHGFNNNLLVTLGEERNLFAVELNSDVGFAMESFLVGANRNKATVYDGLMDDLIVTDDTIVFDDDGEGQLFGDLNADGSIDAGDWTVFKTGQGVDLSVETFYGAYALGDMDFDGDNDIFDFDVFKQVYNEVNGAGALEAVIAAVPEPASAALWVMAATCLVRRRRALGRLAVVAGAVLLLGGGQTAHAQIVFDFGNGDVDGNTGVAANFVVADGSEISTLTNTQDGIEMTLLGITANGPGTYDSNSQGFGIVSATDDGTTGQVRRIDTTNDGEVVQFSFDSDVLLYSLRVGSMESADEGFEIAYVSGDDPFAGGTYTYMTTDNGDTESDTTDILLGDIVVTAGTVMEFRTFNEGGGGILWNDLAVRTGAPAVPITLQVFSDGTMMLVGGTLGGASPPAGIEIDAIQITSADELGDGGSLDPVSFTGLAAAEGFAAGDGQGSGWEQGLSNSDTYIAESFLQGTSTLLTGQTVAVGDGFVPGAEQDLEFLYREAGSGAIVTGVVEYLEVATIGGDFNDDGVVDAADYVVWRDNLDADEAALAGNGNGSGTVDVADYQLWKANFGKSFTAAVTAAPEPAGITLLAVAVLGAARRRR